MKAGLPPRPAMLATLMMQPLLRGSMLSRPIIWVSVKMPRILTFITLSQPATVCVAAGSAQVAPALLTRMSIWPRRLMASSDKRAISASLLLSAAIQSALMPRSFKCATAASRSAALRELTITLAPASPRASAICRPRPREPPVTSAVLPLRSNNALTLRVMVDSLFDEIRNGHPAPGLDLRDA